MQITVLGTMGVGKSTLARSLAELLNLEFHPEPFEPNPYLPLAYRDPEKYGLLTQLAFLPLFIQHSRKSGVLDGSLLSSRYVFAPTYLAGSDLENYCKLYSAVEPDYQTPDLYVCLDAEPETLAQRVNSRGRDMEAGVSVSWIEELNDKMRDLYTRLPNKLVLDWNEYGTSEDVAKMVFKTI